MNIIKIGILGLTAVVCAMTVKEQKPQFAALISLSAALLISYSGILHLKTISELFENLMSYTAMKRTYFAILMKIAGISYLADFSAGICKDCGYQAIGGQIEVFAKIAVLTVSMPVMLALFQTVTGFLG